MKPNLNNNARDSDMMRPSARLNGPRDESELIKLQGKVAGAAARQAGSELIRSLGRLIDPSGWAKSYPVASTASAAAAGFVVALAVVPGPKPSEQNGVSEPTASSEKSDHAPGLWVNLLSYALGTLRDAVVPVIQQALVNHLKNPQSDTSKEIKPA